MTGAPVRVAVLIPCYNEERAIADVVREFRAALPAATVYVYDNGSTDRTAAEAAAARAVVRYEDRRGKGHVVRRMFADVDADVFVLVDGDATYDARSARPMIRRLLDEQLDMVVARRVPTETAAYRAGHRLGNAMLSGLIARLFGARFKDVFSGYRVLSRRLVKSFPALARGFETETELTVHALELRLPSAEIPTPYRARRGGSVSKLRTIVDGLRIVGAIVLLVERCRPLAFFAAVTVALAALGWIAALPNAAAAAVLSLACGLVLDVVAHGRRELRRLAYLAIPPIRPGAQAAGEGAAPVVVERQGVPGHRGSLAA